LFLTKADKQGILITKKNVEQFHGEMLKTWETLPKTFITSAETKAGRDEILDFVDQMVMAYQT